MDNIGTVIDDMDDTTKDKLAKVILGSIAGFATEQLVRKAYDKIIKSRR